MPLATALWRAARVFCREAAEAAVGAIGDLTTVEEDAELAEPLTEVAFMPVSQPREELRSRAEEGDARACSRADEESDDDDDTFFPWTADPSGKPPPPPPPLELLHGTASLPIPAAPPPSADVPEDLWLQKDGGGGGGAADGSGGVLACCGCDEAAWLGPALSDAHEDGSSAAAP